MLPNPLETADLVTFTEEILNGKLHFLCTMFHCHKNFHPVESLFLLFGTLKLKVSYPIFFLLSIKSQQSCESNLLTEIYFPKISGKYPDAHF